ncbi:MAG: tetratricopeptide repeat protein [Rhizobiales bacterium]|nr:tetratricopeptide repeat protein [Hyphomicrobiales bacterium]
MYDQAAELQKKGDCTGAIEKLNLLLNRDPSMAKARVLRGICHYRAGRNDEALAYYNEAIRVAPQSAAAVYDRGLMWLAKGDDDAALADFSTAPGAPERGFARFELARLGS